MSRAGTAIRLAAFYAAIFIAVGIHIPYWPLWLKDRGLSATEIGLLVAAAYLVKLIANPVVGHVVDHRGDRKRPMLVLAVAASALWLLFPLAESFGAILVMTILAIIPFTTLMPVGDSLAMVLTQERRLDYGRLRLWGSLTFIAAATLMGWALSHWPSTILPWLISAALAVTALSCAALPDIRRPHEDGPPAPLRPLLSNAPFLLFLAAASLNQAAHTVYYAFSTIHWRMAGLSDTTIGLLWSEGVVAEILLFALSGRAVARFGPARLLLAAGIAGLIRWTVLGLTTDLTALALAQLLHGATFGCAHLGTMHFISRAVPPSLAVRAQGLHSAIAVGLAPGLMMPASGALFDHLGGLAFLVMAVLSAGSAWAAWRLAGNRQPSL